jgi:tetratricopeptide (TPR) repeat protein
MASDDKDAFLVSRENYSRMVEFFNIHEESQQIYLSEIHALSHLFFTNIDDLISIISPKNFSPTIAFKRKENLYLGLKILEEYSKSNRKIMDLAKDSDGQGNIALTLNTLFMNNDEVLTLLKQAELAEAEGDYKKETKILFKLRKLAEYRMFLQSYIFKVLKHKEDYYYNAALQLEKEKKWDDAMELYQAVLSINNNNFNANYRMGLLYITLQDIENSFEYFQNAMKLDQENPKVLFQMGILFYSTGEIDEAIGYFKRAIQQDESSAALYRYLGLCYEKIGKLNEAARNYSRAVIADPNDRETKERLEDVKKKIDHQRKGWEMPEKKNEFEAELDSDMPLPISKSAYEVRLKDDDTSLPVVDADGNEIESKDQDAVRTDGTSQ